MRLDGSDNETGRQEADIVHEIDDPGQQRLSVIGIGGKDLCETKDHLRCLQGPPSHSRDLLSGPFIHRRALLGILDAVPKAL